MRIGIRGRLFALSLVVIAGVGLSSGLYLERALRVRLEARIDRELVRLAAVSRELVTSSRSGEDLQALARRLGDQAEARITMIGADGRVLGDSALSRQELARVENHSDRPEVRAALARGQGQSVRWSDTLQTEMMYVALATDEGRVIRAAMDLREVDRSVASLRLLLVVAGLLGLGVAVLVGALASHLTARQLRLLVDHAHEVAGGAGGRIHLSSSDELGHIAGSFNRLAAELDRTVESLASERDRLEIILQSMSEGVFAVDAEARVTLVNAAALEQLGLSEPPIDRRLQEVVEAEALAALVDEVGRAGAEGRDVAEVELELPGGPRVLARARPLRFSAGAVVVLYDVTERRRLERVRRDFVANVSHELRTPVSVVQANAETLLDGALDDRALAESFTEAIHRNAQRLSRIITDLLDLSRIEAGTYSLELGQTPLAPVVGGAIEAVEKAAAAKAMTIENRIDPELTAWADATALDHVLLNLLDNAVKYTPEGGHVEVRAVEIDRLVRLEVVDDGPGVKPKYRARIFERFYRVDKGRSRQMGGTGLGLSITKHLVENMSGEVGFEPASPEGSIFWFTLPQTPQLEPAEADAGDDEVSLG